MPQIAIALLAAGRGSRFGSPASKLLAPYQGNPLISHALAAALHSGLHPVLVVLGYEAESFLPHIPPPVKVVYNPLWQQGLAWSLKAVLVDLAQDPDIAAVCVGLGDQPLIGSGAYQKLAAAFTGGVSLAVATYQGERRNPVLLARSLWPAALDLQGDEGARQLMTRYAVEDIPCDGTGDPKDIDTPDDLTRLPG